MKIDSQHAVDVLQLCEDSNKYLHQDLQIFHKMQKPKTLNSNFLRSCNQINRPVFFGTPVSRLPVPSSSRPAAPNSELSSCSQCPKPPPPFMVLVCKWQETSIRQLKSSPPPPRLSKHSPILLHLLLLSSFTSFSCSAASRFLRILLLLLNFFSFERSQNPVVLLSVFFQRKHKLLALPSSYQSSSRCWF